MPTSNMAIGNPVVLYCAGSAHPVQEGLIHITKTKGGSNLTFKIVTLIWLLLLKSGIKILGIQMVQL